MNFTKNDQRFPSQQHLLREDLDHILKDTKTLWEGLKNQRIFITGGTGFFGCWFLESFIWANQALDLNAEAVVLTRDIKKFEKKAPHISSSDCIKFIHGDVNKFVFPEGVFIYIIHAASGTNEIFDTIVNGTQRVLDFAIHCKAKKILFLSSGAVYGKQSSEAMCFTEEGVRFLDPDDKYYSYALGKQLAEKKCIKYKEEHGLDVKIARCFTFVGPYFSLERNFAIGDFISNRLSSADIVVKGDGMTIRSYLYAADMIIWLWHLLLRQGKELIYNVGSDCAISILDLAKIVSERFEPKLPIKILNDSKNYDLSRYVPSVARIKNEFELKQHVSIEEAICKTIKWRQLCGQAK